MSDTGTQQRDTRPDWMLDPTIATVDEDAIAAVGKEIEDNVQSRVADAFINRGNEEPPAIAPLVTEPVTPTGASVDVSSVGTPSGVQPAPVLTPGEVDPEQPTTFSVQVPGAQPIELTNDQTLELIKQHNWLHGQPQQVLEAWGGIEQGTHQAIPNQEYAAFEAWRKSGSPAIQPNRPQLNPDEVPQDVVDYIRDLEARTNGLPVAPVTDQSQPLTPIQIMQQQSAEVDRRVALTAALASTRENFAKQYSLTEDQLNQLAQAVGQANIIPAISQKYRQVSPVGTVIGEGDPAMIIGEAFESVMATHPHFRPLRDDAIYQSRLAKEREQNNTVNGKKAAAGSLSHIPSAAVSSQGNGSKSIEQMTPQERQEAMVQELAQLMASGEAIN